MPESMPPGGYTSDYLLFWYVVATLAVFAVVAWRAERRRIAQLIGVLGTAAFCFVAGETYLRYVADAPDDGVPTLMSRAWYVRHWRAELNERNTRGPDWPDTPADGKPRTLLLGDDVVAGYGIADVEDTVARLLAVGQPRHDVVGVGVPGWNTAQQLDWLANNVSRVRATRVLLVYSPDDAVDLLPREKQIDVEALGNDRWTFFNPARSFVVDARWYRSAMDDSPWWRDRVTFAGEGSIIRHEERIRRLAGICRANGLALDVAIAPWPGDGESERTHVGIALDLWRRAGARKVVDLTPKLDVTARVSRWAPWPDEGAHRALADALSAEFFDR